jgi:hypothetical protein
MDNNKKHQLSLTLEGLPQDDGNVRLADFLRELQLLSSALSKVDRLVSRENRAATNYRIVDLSHSSPARVVIAAFPRRDMPDVRDVVLSSLFRALSQIQRDEVPDGVGFDVLEDFHSMSQPVGKSLAWVRLAQNGTEISFTPSFRTTVAEILAPQHIAQGFIRGKLEAINLHGSANVFKIYPAVGPSKLACHFPGNLVADAISAVNQDVEIRGALKYRATDKYPYAVEVETIDLLIPPVNGVGLDDIFGLAPDIAGGKPAEDWIADRRIENEEIFSALLG